jgi:probable HAF family extracellular repeat protein
MRAHASIALPLALSLSLTACADAVAPSAERTPPAAVRADLVQNPVAQVEYTAENLTVATLSERSRATAINRTGMIVGWSGPSVDERVAMVFRGLAQGPTSLGVLPGTSSSEALAVNDSGVVVGRSGRFAFVYYPHSLIGMVKLPAADNLDSMVATGINNKGRVVGWISRRPSQLHQAFVWYPGNSWVDEIKPLLAYESEAVAMTDAGEIAMTARKVSWSTETVVARQNADASITDLGPGRAYSIGASGTVGAFTTAGAVRSPGATSWTIFTGHGPITAVSAKGRIVDSFGATATVSSTSSTYGGDVWSWKNLPSAPNGAKALDVNACGDIVGSATTAYGFRAVLWKHAWCD